VFADFAEHLDGLGRSERTVYGYLQDLTIFSRWFVQTNGYPLSPDNLTPTDVRQYRQYMLTVEKAMPASVNRRLAALRAYAAWAKDTGKIETNPVNGVKSAPKQKMAPRWLAKREQMKLMQAVERDVSSARSEPARRQATRDKTIIVLLMHTGLRISELCALDADDLVLSERKGELRVRAGKGEKFRSIPLNNAARAALREWSDLPSRRCPEFIEGCCACPDADAINGIHTVPVFTGRRGDRLTASVVQRRLAEYGRRASVEATPHTLRHTFAKNLVDAGVTLEKVAALMGHTSLDTTRLYTTPSLADLDRAVQLLAE